MKRCCQCLRLVYVCVHNFKTNVTVCIQCFYPTAYYDWKQEELKDVAKRDEHLRLVQGKD